MNDNAQTPSTQISSPSTEPYRQILYQGMKHFQCIAPNCQKMFRFKSDMERHLIVHSNDRPHPCPHPGCNKSFKRLDALKNHLTSHDEAFPSVCPYAGCGAQFNNKSALQFHLIKHQMQTQEAQAANPSKNQEPQVAKTTAKKASKPIKKLNTLQEGKPQPVGDEDDLSSDDGFGDSEDEAECLERIKERKGYQTEKFIEQAVKDIKSSLEAGAKDTREIKNTRDTSTREHSDCGLSSASSTHGVLERLQREKPASEYGLTEVLGAHQCLEKLASENAKMREKVHIENMEQRNHQCLEKFNAENAKMREKVNIENMEQRNHQCLEKFNAENQKLREKVYTEQEIERVSDLPKAQIDDDFKFVPAFEGLKLGSDFENKNNFGFEYFLKQNEPL